MLWCVSNIPKAKICKKKKIIGSMKRGCLLCVFHLLIMADTSFISFVNFSLVFCYLKDCTVQVFNIKMSIQNLT